MTGSGAPRVVLHGPPGSLATELARELARRWGVPLCETDVEVERALGAPVSEIFVTQGESAFRDAERDAVRAGITTPGVVLLLGSGAITQPEVATLLQPLHSRVVFVDVTLTEAARQLGFVGGPPGLGSPRSSWQRLMTQQRPLYEAGSGHQIVVQADGVAAAADHVERVLQED